MSENKKYVIIDTDCGIDDALGLMLAFDSHRKGLIEILGITCVYGNVSVDKVVRNVLITQRVCKIENVKIFKGCETPLKDDKGFEDGFMGSDGLGDSTKSMPKIDVNIDSEHAVHAMIRLSKQYPKQITLVALGPLTNLAMASHMDPNFLNNLSHLVAMGGLIDMLGNVWPTTEFNFVNDPESVHVVLSKSKCRMTIVPYDTCIRQKLPWDMFDKIVASGKEKAIFFGKIYQMIEKDFIYGRNESKGGIVLCDIVAIIAGVFPQLVSFSDQYSVAMELSGQLTRGTLVVERTPRIVAFPGSRKAGFVIDMDLGQALPLVQQMLVN